MNKNEEVKKDGWLKYTGLHDVMFKHIVSGEYGIEILCELFNQICPGYELKPKEVISKTTEITDYVELKTVRLDIRFSFGNVKVNIESQRYEPKYNFAYRIDIYTSKLQTTQERKGEKYNEIRPVIVIAICGFDALKNGKWMTIIKPHDIEDGNGYCYDWKTNIYIQLPYIEECAKMWLKEFFKIMSSHYPEDYKGRDEMMDNTIKEIKRLNSNKEVIDEIVRYEDAYESYHAELKANFKEGLEEGKIEGKIEVAQNLKEINMPIDIIASVTGLTKEEIEKL